MAVELLSPLTEDLTYITRQTHNRSRTIMYKIVCAVHRCEK